MIGTTREEMAAFYCIDKEVENAPMRRGRRRVRVAVQDRATSTIYDEIRRMRASGTNAALLGDLMTDAMFRIGSLRMAECAEPTRAIPPMCISSTGSRRPGSKSCHCLEIPFVFNNFSNWTDSPMLKGANPTETAGLAEAMHGAWIAFARTGKPDHRAPAGVAGLSARGPHDHALRQRDRPGQRSRRAAMAATLDPINFGADELNHAFRHRAPGNRRSRVEAARPARSLD